MLTELKNVDSRLLERADVSKREWEAIQLLLDVDKDIFHEEAKIHMTNYLEDKNPFSNFVDFTRLPDDLPKAAKDLLYRPQKMAKLNQAYCRLVKLLENDYVARKLEIEAWEAQKHKKLRFHGRIARKAEAEVQMLEELCQKLDEVFVSRPTEELMEGLTNPDLPGLQLTDHRDWCEPLLAKLIRERRKMPKKERLEKFRNDSVDEVDTTDLENWTLRGRWNILNYTEAKSGNSYSPGEEELAREVLGLDPGD